MVSFLLSFYAYFITASYNNKYEPVHEILGLIALATSDGSEEPVILWSLTRAFTNCNQIVGM